MNKLESIIHDSKSKGKGGMFQLFSLKTEREMILDSEYV